MHDAMVTNRHSAAWLRAMREIEAEGSPSPAAHCPPPAGIEAAAAMWRSGGAAPPIADGAADTREEAIRRLLIDAAHMPYGTWENFQKRGYTIEEISEIPAENPPQWIASGLQSGKEGSSG